MRKLSLRIFAALVLVASAHAAGAQQWPQWRGPDANLVIDAADFPVTFSPSENVQWAVDLPGEGTSTPIVWGDAIFVTSVHENQDTITSYDLAGQERWTKHLGDAREARNRAASGSNPSPVTDGEHVVAYFKSGNLVCLNTQGEQLWRVNLQDKYGEDTLWWDLGTSPVLTSAGVAVAVMQEGTSYLVTLDLDSGEVVWKTQRQYERPRESDQSYTTPSVEMIDGRETIVTWGADHLTGHDAKTGELLWDSGGFNPQDRGMWRTIASAAVEDGVAVVPFGRGDFVAAVRLGGSGDITESARMWERERIGADVPTPVIVEDKVYVVGNSGQATCLDLESGETIWSGDLPAVRRRAEYYSSPLIAGDLMFAIRNDGLACVASIDGGLNVLAQNDLQEQIVSTPVPVGDTLLVRTRTKLYRFAKE